MPEAVETDKDRAKQAVSELLNNLQITQVVYVDDLFARIVDFADVQAAQLTLSTADVKEILGAAELNLPDDVEVRREVFRRHWGSLSADEQTDKGRAILTKADATPSVQQQDPESAEELEEIVGSERLKKLAPAEWKAQQETILAEAKARRTLLLFDQDLRDGGESEVGGIMIIRNILGTAGTQDVMCGLLTHTATLSNSGTLPNEDVLWQQLATQHQVDPDRFLVVAKEGLTTDPVQFARMLKKVALSPGCREMKRRVHDLVSQGAADAKAQLDKLSVHDFEHVVLRTARDEGLWEPEMLLRLFNIYQRDELRKRAYNDQPLKDLTVRLRGLSHIPTDSPSKPKPSSWKIQKLEMYEPGEHINSLHLPIEIGDIFVKTEGEGSKAYILLGQPCDLMVRSDGNRRPELGTVLLAEVHSVPEPTPNDEELGYFGDDPTKRHFVRMKRVNWVPIDVLDLCVFNTDGVARLPRERPTGMPPAWDARYAHLLQSMSALLDEYKKFGSEESEALNAQALDSNAKGRLFGALRDKLVKMFPPFVGRKALFKPSISGRSDSTVLTFNCKRIMRLHHPRAAAMVLQYASCFSRPAFDRDLGVEGSE